MGTTSRASILSVGTAVPPHVYTQDEVCRLAGYGRRAIESIFRNSAIEQRNLALEPGHVPRNDPQWFSDHYAAWAPRLAVDACREALGAAALDIGAIDYLVATSCTGYVCPGISQLVARELGAGPRVKTANLVGMGCNAAVPALERAAEFAERHPGSNVLVVATEVCSATYWIDEGDLESVVGNAIFADGASAAVVAAPAAGRSDGAPRAGSVRLLEFASRADRSRIGHMGFHNEAGRLRVMLSREVPELVVPLAGAVVAELLDAAKLTAGDVPHWIVHPGGRRILELLSERWGLGERLKPSWDVLAGYGNMSSATLLFVLDRILSGPDGPRPKSGELGILLAMGPGLSVEGAFVSF